MLVADAVRELDMSVDDALEVHYFDGRGPAAKPVPPSLPTTLKVEHRACEPTTAD